MQLSEHWHADIQDQVLVMTSPTHRLFDNLAHLTSINKSINHVTAKHKSPLTKHRALKCCMYFVLKFIMLDIMYKCVKCFNPHGPIPLS